VPIQYFLLELFSCLLNYGGRTRTELHRRVASPSHGASAPGVFIASVRATVRCHPRGVKKELVDKKELYYAKQGFVREISSFFAFDYIEPLYGRHF